MKNDDVTVAFLSAGGINPRVDGIGLRGETSGLLFPMSPRETAYALAPSPDGSKMVIGARLGLLYVVDLPFERESTPVFILNQGAPVLSVCFAGNDRFAVSDTLGRVLLWSTTAADQMPTALHEDECPLCALTGIDGGVVGHRAGGGIMVWDLERPLCPVRIDCPKPATPLALSRGIWWEAARAVAFPGEGGVLVIYDLDRRTVRSMEAHIGGFNAAALLGDMLVTFGCADRIMNAWNPVTRGVAYQRRAPLGVISAAAIDDNLFVLVHRDGMATTVTMTEDGVCIVERLPGSDYRTVASLAPKLLADLRKQERASEVSHLQEILDSTLDGESEAGAEEHLKRLEMLGAHSVVLAYRAQKAGLAWDLLEELRLRCELAELIPDSLASLDSLRRLARLLEVLWCLEDAKGILDRISQITSGDPARATSTERIRRQAALLREGKAILKPEKDLPLHTLIEAADIMGRPFHHTCLIRQLDPLTFNDIEICMDDFITKYESYRENNRDRLLPPVESCELALIEGHEELVYETSVVIPVQQTSESGFRLAIGFHASSVGTVVTTRVLLDVKAVHPLGPPKEHNVACLRLLERMFAGAISQTEIRYMHETCGKLLAKLVNEIKGNLTRRVCS